MQRSDGSKNSLEGKWLITGGRGFIGTNLRIALDKNYPKSRVAIVDNRTNDTGYRNDNVTKLLYDIDVVNYESLYDIFAETTPDYVVHLAGNTEVRKSLKRPHLCFTDNIDGTLNCLNLSREFKVKKVVIASSCGVVGDRFGSVNEEAGYNPLSPYAASKVCAEVISKSYEDLGVPVTILRFSNIFGPWSDHKSSVVGSFIKRFIDKRTIPVYGDGNQTRNFLYVKDAVEAIFRSIQSNMTGIFCVGNLKSYSVNEVIEILEGIFGYTVKQNNRKEMGGEIRSIEIDTKKARMGLHFHCGYSFLDGIKETCDWYKEIKHAD